MGEAKLKGPTQVLLVRDVEASAAFYKRAGL